MRKDELIWFEFAEPAAQGNSPAIALAASRERNAAVPAEGLMDEGLFLSLALWVGYGRCSANGSAQRSKQRQEEQPGIQSNKKKEREWTLLRRQQPTKRIGVGAAEERRSKVNGAPSSSRCAASPTNSIQLFFLPLKREEKWMNLMVGGLALLLFNETFSFKQVGKFWKPLEFEMNTNRCSFHTVKPSTRPWCSQCSTTTDSPNMTA